VIFEEVPLEGDTAETGKITRGHASFIHAAIGINVDEATRRVKLGQGRVFDEDAAFLLFFFFLFLLLLLFPGFVLCLGRGRAAGGW